MVKYVKRAAWLGCILGVIASEGQVHAAATMSLKAVAKNGQAITPTTNLTNVAVGDTITVELRISGWRSPLFDAGNGDTGLVRLYQARVNGLAGAQGVSGSGQGYITPAGWDAPLTRVNPPCTDPLYPVANPAYGCVGPAFQPNDGASINIARNDWILAGWNTQSAVANDSINFRWGGTIFESDGNPDGRCNGGALNGLACVTSADCLGSPCVASEWYGGTYNLVARTGVCGTYRFDLVADPAVTFIGNPSIIAYTMLPDLQPLTITAVNACPPQTGACCDTTTGAAVCTNNVLQTACTGTNLRWGGAGSTCANINPPCTSPTGACCNNSTGLCANGVLLANCSGANQRWGGANSTCATLDPPCDVNRIVGSNPGHCAIDARIPFLANQPAQRRGFTSIDLTFERTAGATEDAPGDFTVQQFPVGVATVIQNVVQNGNVVTINFTAPIQTRRWTCVLHNASNTRRCLGFLPADANGNRTANPTDILSLIDNLNGVLNPAMAIYQCDIDRSNVCNPTDILSLIDLLNGASGWPVFNAATLEVCPSTTGP